MPPHREPALAQDFDGLLLRPVHAVAIGETRIPLPAPRRTANASLEELKFLHHPLVPAHVPSHSRSKHIRFLSLGVLTAIIIASYHAINVASYIPTHPLHKAVPAGNMGHRGLAPIPDLPSRHPYAPQPPATGSSPRNRQPLPSLPAFNPHEKAPASKQGLTTA